MNIKNRNIPTGTIFFSGHDSGFIGKAIAWFTNSWMSHTFIIRGELKSGESITLETTTTVVSQNNFQNTYIQPGCRLMGFEVIDKKPEDIQRAVQMCDGLLGRTYGYFRILGYVIMHIFFLKNQPVRAGIWCCDITLTYLKALGYDWVQDINNWQMDPPDVQQLLMCHPESFRYIYFKDFKDSNLSEIID